MCRDNGLYQIYSVVWFEGVVTCLRRRLGRWPAAYACVHFLERCGKAVPEPHVLALTLIERTRKTLLCDRFCVYDIPIYICDYDYHYVLSVTATVRVCLRC